MTTPPRTALLVGVTLGLTSLTAIAANPNRAAQVPQAQIPLLTTPPVIDGRIEPGEWDTLRVHGLVSGRYGLVDPREGDFWVGADAQHLYLALRTEIHPHQALLTRAQHAPQVTKDDSVEFWIDPYPQSTATTARYYQLMFNSAGISHQAAFDRAGQPDNTWRSRYQLAQQQIDGFWHFEIAIELDSFKAAVEPLATPWRMRIIRNWKMPWVQAGWSPQVSAFSDRDSMALVAFDPAAPVVQQLAYRDAAAGKVLMTFRLKNPSAKPQAITCTFGHNEIDQPRHFHTEDVLLAPGAEETVSYERDVAGEGRYQGVSEVRISSPDDQTVYFAREYGWKLDPAAVAWAPVPTEAISMFDLAYYPYLNKLKVRLDLASFKHRDRVKSIRLEVRPAGGDVLVATVFPPPSDDGQAEVFADLPELPSGDYEVKVFLEGEGVPTEPMTRTFERRRFIWEHNQIGLSDEVIPPFTPIEVAGDTVKTILREHQMSDLGLWRQVISQGEALLAAPMTLEISANQQVLPIQSGGVTFDKARPQQVTGHADWTSGDLQGRTEFGYDYDGLMMVTVRLTAAQPTAVERVRLRVPIKLPHWPLLHTVTDGIRMNYAGKLPAGEGVVWTSREANRGFLAGTFLPYIYIGGPARGLCWMAESDADWVTDPKVATTQIERTGEIVYLNVDFVSVPVTLAGTRTFVFGLQATPVKPRPPGWRRWGERASYYPFRWWYAGTGALWGSANVALWPTGGVGRDYMVVQKLDEARRTGIIDQAFIEQVCLSFDPLDWYKRPQDDPLVSYRGHLQSGFNTARGMDAISAYVNLSGALMCTPEWWTFQDAWTFEPYLTRNTRDDHREMLIWNETSTASSPSRRDFMLYYYKKLLEAGIDGINWDNVYAHPDRDPFVTQASRQPDGSLRPAVATLAVRDVIKRTAVLAHELGKPRCNIPHMTNAHIVPILSFADLTLDWEWKYGNSDCQDRFSPDFILAESTGLQSGNIPFVLFPPATDPDQVAWIRRTGFGACVVHELKSVHSWGEPFDSAYPLLYRFGYGSEACQVNNYWEPDPVVTLAGSDVKFIALLNGNRLIVIVTDYGEGGPIEMRLNYAKAVTDPFTRARDFETGDVLACRDGTLRFMLRKHDFKILLFGEGEF
ncbi:MAG: hypothetical protein HQ523_09195 [Lentisphaerae bacterium]|nr:hypothetical protein [Lentisphaerota bacterium]